jgi:hypothetical protein
MDKKDAIILGLIIGFFCFLLYEWAFVPCGLLGCGMHG